MKIAVAGATGRVGRHTVDVLTGQGHEVVRMSRATGVDLVTGDGLDAALAGVEVVVDAATGPSSDQDEATAFFTAAARNLREAAARAGVRRIVVVSIIGIENVPSGYNVAKIVHEDALRAGPVPVVVLRAAQFHEFVAQLLEWTTKDGVADLPRMRTQVVAARTVGEELARLALDPDADPGRTYEVAGPREENLAGLGEQLAAHRGDELRVREVSDPADPATAGFADGGLLPGPDALLAGPTFEEWLLKSGADAPR
jgi:uncharacterized protein YbjT (DUF2867 family)